MKITRASIPIGTIAIIIIVLIASFGMWWYFMKAGDDDCDDVRYWDTDYGRRWTRATGENYPYVNRDDRSANIESKWMAGYIKIGGGAFGWHYPTLQELEDAIDGWPDMRAEDNAILHRIIDCIQAGCPSCRRIV